MDNNDIKELFDDGCSICLIYIHQVNNLEELQTLAKQVKQAALLRGDDSPGCVLSACDHKLVRKLADDIYRIQFCS